MNGRRLLRCVPLAAIISLLAALQTRAWAMPWPLTLAVALALGAAALIRHRPAAVAVAAAALTACTYAGYGQGRLGWPWPAVGCAELLILLYRQSARTRRRDALAAGVLIPLAMLVPAAWTVPLPWGLILLTTTATLVALWLGDSARTRREAQTRLRQESARLAVLQERARIARDLHDVVAHHLSLIALESQAAPLRTPALPPAATESFAQVHRLARAGLVEMRSLLRLLRSRNPDLPALIAQFQAAGAVITCTADAALDHLPEVVQLTAYRIVQESLSNATRHAPGAPIQLAITQLSGRVRLTVSNAVPAMSDMSEKTEGLGLVGMRERVAALGGTLVAGSSPEGFIVEAELPTDGGVT
ncbi:hypothetical protein Dvina_11355 [Dactylosporangium vinaceum]|uniref:histidine kinase n=1 Tax=Dactylosporangium vinaceum TaxID=53362 RepID=A0ABV5MN03_9ACTN|nr:histidine kinase [Dactylosporangium vinaceum]UAB98624.1 hypothetical protein Dvina_11355 [Dactylosporangium vinaceum]